MISKTLLAGCFIWAVFLFTLLILRPKSKLHSPLLNPAGSTPPPMDYFRSPVVNDTALYHPHGIIPIL